MAKGQIKQKQATINQKQFEGMCYVQCTKEEMCAILDVGEETLSRWCRENYGMNFENAYKKYSQGGKMSLRRNMFRQAEHNATMAIWLSKQHLGMKDVVENQNIDMSKVDKLLDSLENMADYVNNDESIENTENTEK